MSYTTNRFAIRTVKEGTITIGGKVFRPREWYQERDGCLRKGDQPKYHDLPYQGELDGMRLAFGRYKSYETEGEYEQFVSLWGTEDYFFRTDGNGWPGPNCIGNVFHWDWWYTEDEWQAHKHVYRVVA